MCSARCLLAGAVSFILLYAASAQAQIDLPVAQEANRNQQQEQSRPASQQQEQQTQQQQSTQQEDALQENAEKVAQQLEENTTDPEELEQKSDGSWVTVQGVVVAERADSYILDHGEGTITIEVDNWDRANNADIIAEGDKITARGRLDDDFYHERSIEADLIYVEDHNTVLAGPQPVDEETIQREVMTRYFGPINYDIEVVGAVSAINDDSFTIDTDARRITVDISQMDQDPLDASGYLELEEGDLVRAAGNLSEGDMSERVLVAERVLYID